VPEDWVESEVWRTWPAPLNLIRGEAHYSEVLRRYTGPPREHGYLVPVPVTLKREPANPYDPNAIRAEVGGELVGYIMREAVPKIAHAFDTLELEEVCLAGLIRGGSTDRPNLGIFVWGRKRLTACPALNWNSAPWPPRDREGTG
jgi:hypothetical protein